MDPFNDLFNFIGGTMRWLVGFIYSAIQNKPNFTFRQYIHGIEDSEDQFETLGHGFVNVMIGLATLVLLLMLFIRLF